MPWLQGVGCGQRCSNGHIGGAQGGGYYGNSQSREEIGILPWLQGIGVRCSDAHSGGAQGKSGSRGRLVYCHGYKVLDVG